MAGTGVIKINFRNLVFLCLPILAACGGSSGGDDLEPVIAFGSDPELSASYVSTDITLDWSDRGATYNLYYAQESVEMVGNYGVYEGANLIQDATPPVTVTVPSLKPVYFFRLTKIENGIESQPSNEIIVTPRYTVTNGGASIIDEVNRLEWDRCVSGQTWNDSTQSCDGEPNRVNYLGGAGALGLANDANARVPTIPEWYSLFRVGDEFYYDLDNRDVDYSLEKAQTLDAPRTISNLFVDPGTSVRYWAASDCSQYGPSGDVTNFVWPGENSIGAAGVRCGSYNFELYLRALKRL
ncbi:MAG: hypothetical protein ABJG15_07680 [Hyphomonadaceae bacterium]|uniref:hypothetical protein n=1 Tax=Roseibium sp. TaxID=1936156 RepID=UPI0032647F19